MKKTIFFSITYITCLFWGWSQSINHANATYNTCSAIYYDSGGPGPAFPSTNYSDNENSLITFNPSTPGQYVRATFAYFDVENNYDFLIAFDGNSGSAPIIGIYTGTTLPPTLTASNSSGALSFRFFSDNATRRPGWVANISCVGTPGTTPSSTAQDCGGGHGITICSNQTFSANSLGSGVVEELEPFSSDPPWTGCLNNGETQSSWYYFSPSSSGTAAFTIDPHNNSDDYDFAIWGPYSQVSCPAFTSHSPLRCSYSSLSDQTGLRSAAVDFTEGAGGDSWVAPIAVTAGEVYVMVIDNYSNSGQPYDVIWNLSGGASLDCTPLPVIMHEFNGTYVSEINKNKVYWTTYLEINNKEFELQSSNDMESWKTIARVPGNGNSNEPLDYLFWDDSPWSVTYYRLIQHDYNGKQETFGPITVYRDFKDQPLTAKVYPNPADEFVTIETSYAGEVEILLTDAMGKIVKHEKMLLSGNANMLSLTGVSRGIYNLQVRTEYQTETKKLVIQ